MTYRFFQFTFLAFSIFLACQIINAQTAHQLFIEVQKGEKNLSKCQPKTRRISHFCYNFCPTRLVKPLYPDEAKRLRISGLVKIEVIVNENGKVAYARTLEGKPYLSQAARQAAYRSTFQPRTDCDKKPIKFRGTIIYNFFIPNR